MKRAVLKAPGIYYFDGMTVKKLRKLQRIDIFGEDERPVEIEYPIKNTLFTKKAKDSLMHQIRFAIAQSWNLGFQAGYNNAVDNQFADENDTAIFD